MKDEQAAELRREARKKYIGYGVTAFIVIAASVVLIFAFVRVGDVSDTFGIISTALEPVLYGLVFAYLMNPVVRFIENGIKRAFCKRVKNFRRVEKTVRYISIFITIVFVLTLVTMLIYLVAPELTTTISGLISELPRQADNFLIWFDSLIKEPSGFADVLQRTVQKLTEYFENFVENGLLASATTALEYLASGVWSVFGVLYNIVIGLVFSIYILASKERFMAQSKKIIYALFKKSGAERIITTAGMCHQKFIGAILGKILDSALVGVICFVGMTVIGLPYTLLISVIVGITNVIPFFGPYLGAIPSTILILFVDPWQALYFVIFILILQQIDCNILDPRIVGGSIGLSAFWVLFACVVFGSIFGIAGLLLGVPFFACVYMIAKEFIESRLSKKGLSSDTEAYSCEGVLPEQEAEETVPVAETADNEPEEEGEKENE